MSSPATLPGIHIREHTSVLAPAEKRLLVWIAERLPARLVSDHLTGLALVSMVAAGCSFAAIRLTRWAALGVVMALVVKWFGDSLDGTLARVRRQERPRYGFYVDHVIDLAGAALLLGGLACSGAMDPLIALALLSAYLMVAAESFLSTHAAGTFRLSCFGFGPTELRLVLIAGALRLIRGPWASLGPFGRHRLFDVGGVIAIVGLATVFLVSALGTARLLYRLEPPARERR